MEKCSHLLPAPLCSLISCSLILLLISSFTPSALSATRRPISESEIRDKKNGCYADIESGLWGWKCRSSITEKENCALRCLSAACYELIYGSDPLEEGEKDHSRNHEYKYCLHKMIFYNTKRLRFLVVRAYPVDLLVSEDRAWTEAIGDKKKGRVYGLGSQALVYESYANASTASSQMSSEDEVMSQRMIVLTNEIEELRQM